MKKLISAQGEYMVSKDGQVWKNGQKLAPNRCDHGYLSYWIDGKRVSAGRVVVEAYLGPLEGRVVKYKDGCPWNIHVDNLEVISHSERALTRKPNWWTLPDEPARKPDSRTRRVCASGVEYTSINEAAKTNSTHRGCISRAIRTGKPHKGVVFSLKK